MQELLPLLQAELASSASPDARQAAGLLDQQAVLQGLLEYSRSIAHAVPSAQMAMSEFAWRNGALLRIAHTPLHVAWLRRARVPEAMLLRPPADGADAGTG